MTQTGWIGAIGQPRKIVTNHMFLQFRGPWENWTEIAPNGVRRMLPTNQDPTNSLGRAYLYFSFETIHFVMTIVFAFNPLSPWQPVNIESSTLQRIQPCWFLHRVLGQIQAGPIIVTSLLHQGRSRCLSKHKDQAGCWKRGKAWTSPKYEHTMDKYPKICFPYVQNDMLRLFLSWYTIVGPSWPTIDSEIWIQAANIVKHNIMFFVTPRNNKNVRQFGVRAPIFIIILMDVRSVMGSGNYFLDVRSTWWYQDFGTNILVTRSWYQYFGTKMLVPRSWYHDPGTKILVPRSWYQHLGTKILVPRS